MYIRWRIEHGPTAAIRRRGRLAAWALTHGDGSLGFLHVLDAHLADQAPGARTIVDRRGEFRNLAETPLPRWDLIDEVARSVAIPVIGNGDLLTPWDLDRRRGSTQWRRSNDSCQVLLIVNADQGAHRLQTRCYFPVGNPGTSFEIPADFPGAGWRISPIAAGST